MKLNPDCIRDILLCVEADSGFTTMFRFESENPPEKLSNYSTDEILYHAKQLYQAQLITDFTPYAGGTFFDIEDLSPYGHEFIANIRQDNIWEGVKSTAKKIGSSSLDALTVIASNVVSELIKAHFGI